MFHPLIRILWTTSLVLTLGFYSSPVWGWGELGHHLTAHLASELIAKHPRIIELRRTLKERGDKAAIQALDHFLDRFFQSRLELGQLGNIPDTYWRHLDPPWDEKAKFWGSPTHYLDTDGLANKTDKPVALKYENAKSQFSTPADKPWAFFQNGTAPWRAQQFADLYLWSLQHHPSCQDAGANPLARKWVLSFAGLMTHFLADGSMPLHSAQDFDGYQSRQGGIHWYFENDLVNELEPDLEKQVLKSAAEWLGSSKASFTSQMAKIYPNLGPSSRVVAQTLTLLKDSYSKVPEMRALDEKYAIATLGDAMALHLCDDNSRFVALQEKWEREKDATARKELLKTKINSGPSEKEGGPACRRFPSTLVSEAGDLSRGGSHTKSVAEWNRKLIVSRLALSTAIIADDWVSIWMDAGQPELCRDDANSLRPAFVSPDDPSCFGYALSEAKRDSFPGRGETEKCLAE